MAPLWRWSDDAELRTGKDEQDFYEVVTDKNDSVGRKKFVPFNRFYILLTLKLKYKKGKRELKYFCDISV